MDSKRMYLSRDIDRFSKAEDSFEHLTSKLALLTTTESERGASAEFIQQVYEVTMRWNIRNGDSWTLSSRASLSCRSSGLSPVDYNINKNLSVPRGR